LKSKALVLLSGEGNTVPLAEAKSLFMALDPSTTFESPSPRVLLAETRADPFLIGSRIAFARRVGPLIENLELADFLKGHSVRFRCFSLTQSDPPDPERYLKGIGATVDLRNPDYEVTLVRTGEDYLALTAPGTMRQGWSRRRPRSRPFFHPSAIFPKLSRALMNLSGCKEGDVFLDPFCGTGSIPIEASIIGARVVAVDQSGRMVHGAIANMRHFNQEWLGVLRTDSASLPLTEVDAVATDIPYGRASSTMGREPRELLDLLLPSLGRLMRSKSRAVVMHPDQIRVEGGREFMVAEEHDLHVHKLLTRTITVLRRR
jgi:putative methyltransferase (TIGR01177 family)